MSNRCRSGRRAFIAAIFRAALDALGARVEDCLFVGDRADIDVVGAKGIGMDVAWLNAARAELPPGLPAPDFELAGLVDLRPVLQNSIHCSPKSS